MIRTMHVTQTLCCSVLKNFKRQKGKATTYNAPKRNIMDKPIFRRNGVCKVWIMLNGRQRMITSIKVFAISTLKKKVLKLRHRPGVSGFQNLRIGLHDRIATISAAINQSTHKTSTKKEARRNDAIGKIRR